MNKIKQDIKKELDILIGIHKGIYSFFFLCVFVLTINLQLKYTFYQNINLHNARTFLKRFLNGLKSSGKSL